MFLLFNFLNKQRRWTFENFGRGKKTVAILQTIQAEMDSSFVSSPNLGLWTRIIMLACEGAMRQGFTPHEIVSDLERRQAEAIKNTKQPLETSPIEYLL